MPDGYLPAVNGQPQFPIRYGLGNSKVYVSFRGIPDETGEITGIAGSVIEHPIDILKHFLLNYTNINKDIIKLDEDSFGVAKANLENWRFGLAITDVADGLDIINRITKQCKSVWIYKDNIFRVYAFNLDNIHPTIYLEENRDIVGNKKWNRPALSEIYNDFIFKYKYNSITEKYDGVIQRNHKNDQLCRNSYSYYKVIRSHEEIELPDIYDSYTANSLANHYVKLYSMQRQTFDVDLRLSQYTLPIVPGSIVSFTFLSQSGQTGEHIYMCLGTTKKTNIVNASFLELDNPY